MSLFAGMIGTGDWPSNFVPESWGQAIMMEEPQGIAPLFAMSSMFPKRTVPSTAHHWWVKTTPDRGVDVTAGSAIYLNSALSSAYAYTTPAAKDDTLYLKVPASFVASARPGKTIALIDKSNLRVTVEARCINYNENGANSYVVVKLLEADDNAATPSATASLQSVDRFQILSSSHEEGSAAPTSVFYEPIQLDNYTQIFRNTYEQTGTAQAVELRVGDPLDIARKDCIVQHSQDIEWAGIWGTKLGGGSDVGANGKPITKTMGIVNMLREYNSAGIIDFVNDSDYSAYTWLEAGQDFANDNLRTLARYAGSEVVALCGDGALAGMEKLAMTYGHFTLQNTSTGYGMKFRTWVNSNTTVHFMTHPLMSLEASTRNMVILYKPQNIRFLPLAANGVNRDTAHQENMQVPGVDGLLNGYLTEGMWYFEFPNQFQVWFGVGQNGASS